jgi:hypothetical protein
MQDHCGVTGNIPVVERTGMVSKDTFVVTVP